MSRQTLDEEKMAFLAGHFENVREKPLKILVLNILQNRFIEDLEHFFVNATLIGAGNDPVAKLFSHDRVIIEVADPSNIEDLVEIGLKHGRFDLIFDDGSQRCAHQITALRTLFPFLNNGGHYVAYELHPNQHGHMHHTAGIPSQLCYDYLKRLVDLRVTANSAALRLQEDPFLRTYGRSMNLTFFENACLIQKLHKPAEAAPVYAQEPLAPLEGENLPVFISTHQAGIGNVVSETGSIRLETGASAIQGFLLHVREDLQPYVSYRARWQDGSWTDWAPCGSFIGNGEDGSALSGFTVRLDDAVKNQISLVVIGAFGDDPFLHIVRAGEDCAAELPVPLSGMQLILREKQALAA